MFVNSVERVFSLVAGVVRHHFYHLKSVSNNFSANFSGIFSPEKVGANGIYNC